MTNVRLNCNQHNYRGYTFRWIEIGHMTHWRTLLRHWGKAYSILYILFRLSSAAQNRLGVGILAYLSLLIGSIYSPRFPSEWVVGEFDFWMNTGNFKQILQGIFIKNVKLRSFVPKDKVGIVNSRLSVHLSVVYIFRVSHNPTLLGNRCNIGNFPENHHKPKARKTQIKENLKALRHWPLWGEFTGDRWFPSQRASNAANVSIWWRHHAISFAQWLFTMVVWGIIRKTLGVSSG